MREGLARERDQAQAEALPCLRVRRLELGELLEMRARLTGAAERKAGITELEEGDRAARVFFHSPFERWNRHRLLAELEIAEADEERGPRKAGLPLQGGLKLGDSLGVASGRVQGKTQVEPHARLVRQRRNEPAVELHSLVELPGSHGLLRARGRRLEALRLRLGCGEDKREKRDHDSLLP